MPQAVDYVALITQILLLAQPLLEKYPTIGRLVAFLLGQLQKKEQAHLMSAKAKCGPTGSGCFDSLIEYQAKAMCQALALHDEYCPHDHVECDGDHCEDAKAESTTGKGKKSPAG